MKIKHYTKLLMMLLASCLLVWGCEEEENWYNEPPRVAFSVAETALQDIETVNGAGGPTIKGTVQSDAGLKSLTMELIKSSGNEIVEQLSSFDEVNRRIYIFSYKPAYTHGVTGFRVVAVDEQNRTIDRTIPISVKREVPVLTFTPAEGPAGTRVNATVTMVAVAEGTIESLMLGNTEITDYTLGANGRSLSFNIPEDMELGAHTLTLRPVDGDPVVSKTPFTVTETPKVIVAYSNIVVNAQANRDKEGVVTAFSAAGETFTLAQGMDANVSAKVNFIVADSGGDDQFDIFSPTHSWLDNNYYKEMVWPVKNETTYRLISENDPAFFANITDEELNALSVSSDPKPRLDIGKGVGGVGAVILFETHDGKKGLIYVKAHDANAAAGTKADIWTLDMKVLE